MQFFVPSAKQGELISLNEADSHHIIYSLRMKKGDKVYLRNIDGVKYESIIADMTGEKVCCLIQGEISENKRKSVKIKLAQPVINPKSMNFVIQKAVELGISEIYPVITERCNIRLKEKEKDAQINRWERIVYEAFKQCEAVEMPKIHNHIALPDFLISKIDGSLIWFDKDGKQKLNSNFFDGDLKEIILLAGPEGGFTPEEKRVIIERYGNGLSISDYTLRAETASITGIGIINYLVKLT